MKKVLKMANLAITLLAFLCAIHQSFQCSYGPDYKILTIAELTQKAPIVVRGYVVIKGDNVNFYKACLYITHVYKGSGVKNYICATNFGSGAACKSDPSYNVEYLFFLNQEGNQQFGYTYAVRYDNGLFSGTKIFNKEALDGVREGKCCAGVPNCTYTY